MRTVVLIFGFLVILAGMDMAAENFIPAYANLHQDTRIFVEGIAIFLGLIAYIRFYPFSFHKPK